MNHDYLTLMNITLFEEVIYKYLHPTSSQFVVIALVRAGMVYGNKFLWESLIFKKLWTISQEANWIKQKQSTEKRKLEQMQKPTSVQLDEKVEELLNEKMDSTLPNEVRSILTGSIKSSSKNKKSSNNHGVTNTATGAMVGADTSEEKNSEQAPITITIPVTQ